MKVKIEIEVEHCCECPFADYIQEFGYSGTDCSQLNAYSPIPNEGIRQDCPFLPKERNV